MTAALAFITPREALHKMRAAGAVFSVRRSADGLGISFSYSVASGGDAQRCREVFDAAKSRPPAFFAAFRIAVHDVVTSNERGAA